MISFARVNIAAMLIPVIAAIWYLRKWNKPLKVFFWYCLLTFLINYFEQLVIHFATKYYTTIFKPYMDYWEIGGKLILPTRPMPDYLNRCLSNFPQFWGYPTYQNSPIFVR